MSAAELESLYQAAVAQHQAGQLDAALAGYQQVLARDQRFARAWHLLGVLLHQQGQPGQAIESIQRAIALEPQRAVFYTNLGLIYTSLGRVREAEPLLRRAIDLAPGTPSSLLALGSVLVEENRCAEAVLLIEQALARNPLDPIALAQLGLAYSEIGLVGDSIAAYARAHAVSGDPLLASLAASQLPLVYESVADVVTWRRRLVDEVNKLLASGVVGDLTERPAPTIFSLPHQGFNDLEFQRNWSQLFRAPSLPQGIWQPRGRGKPRIGFLSAYLNEHTIGRLFHGLITNLSRDDFHLTVFSAGQHDDPLASELAAAVDRYVVLTRDLPLARQSILENSVDVLVHTDIGMNAMTFALAFSRLAPLQCTTWGHPETTGLGTIDYFVSSDLMESPEADSHYSEKLVRLPSLSLVFHRAELSGSSSFSRADLGLDQTARLYACPQSIYKFHPEFDEALAGILRRDPGGQIVLIRWAYPHADELLKKRFARTMPDVADRVVFVNRMQQPEFLRFLTLIDVLLDPFPYGGGNSSLEGFSFGIPVVTLPTRLLRGRITQAFCRRLGVDACIATNIHDYIEIAVRLGTDAAYRHHVRQQIFAGHSRLFDDMSAVRDWESFFRQISAGIGA